MRVIMLLTHKVPHGCKTRTTMTGYTQLINIIDELKESGVTPKVTVLRAKKAPKRSLLSNTK